MLAVWYIHLIVCWWLVLQSVSQSLCSIEYCSALKSTLFELFTPKRPLKPVRRERKKLKAQNLTISNVNVVVRVIRAFNIPVRDGEARNTRQSTQLDLFEQDRLVSESQDVGGVYTSGERALEMGKACTAMSFPVHFMFVCYMYTGYGYCYTLHRNQLWRHTLTDHKGMWTESILEWRADHTNSVRTPESALSGFRTWYAICYVDLLMVMCPILNCKWLPTTSISICLTKW